MIVKKNMEEETILTWEEASPAEQRRNRARMKREAEQLSDARRESSIFNNGGKSGYKALTAQRGEV